MIYQSYLHTEQEKITPTNLRMYNNRLIDYIDLKELEEGLMFDVQISAYHHLGMR